MTGPGLQLQIHLPPISFERRLGVRHVWAEIRHHGREPLGPRLSEGQLSGMRRYGPGLGRLVARLWTV